MAYFQRIAGEITDLVICDDCLTIEETVYIWLPPYGVRSPDLADCVHSFQKDPWCWAPRYSMKLVPCARCLDPVDTVPMAGWEPHADCACGEIPFAYDGDGRCHAPSGITIGRLHHAPYICSVYTFGLTREGFVAHFGEPEWWTFKREDRNGQADDQAA